MVYLSNKNPFPGPVFKEDTKDDALLFKTIGSKDVRPDIFLNLLCLIRILLQMLEYIIILNKIWVLNISI